MEESVIREHYASMSDEALLNFAKDDATSLTLQARGILRSEFARRGLDQSLLTAWEQPKPIPSVWTNTATSHWQYVIDEKAGGASDEMIMDALTQQGLTREAAIAMIDSLEEVANQGLKKAKDNTSLGVFLCIGGIILTIVTYSAASNTGGSYLICWGPTIFGGIRWSKGATAKKKYEEVLWHIKMEKQAYATKDAM